MGAGIAGGANAGAEGARGALCRIECGCRGMRLHFTGSSSRSRSIEIGFSGAFGTDSSASWGIFALVVVAIVAVAAVVVEDGANDFRKETFLSGAGRIVLLLLLLLFSVKSLKSARYPVARLKLLDEGAGAFLGDVGA